MPVYNEGANIGRALEEIFANVTVPKRVLIVYDFDKDDTVPVARALMPKYPGVVLLKNTLGRGVINAVRAGISATTAEVVIVTMADLSDDLTAVSRMESMIREHGYDVVCASRYMRGGRQIGGPWFKGFLSRMAGLSLHWIAGLPTHDATNAFRAYRRSVLQSIPIESQGGFEYSLELTAKAFAQGCKIGEVPSTWRDRSAGESRFQMRTWLPQYLRWYFWTINRSSRSDRLGLIVVLAVALSLGLERIGLQTIRPIDVLVPTLAGLVAIAVLYKLLRRTLGVIPTTITSALLAIPIVLALRIGWGFLIGR